VLRAGAQRREVVNTRGAVQVGGQLDKGEGVLLAPNCVTPEPILFNTSTCVLMACHAWRPASSVPARKVSASVFRSTISPYPIKAFAAASDWGRRLLMIWSAAPSCSLHEFLHDGQFGALPQPGTVFGGCLGGGGLRDALMLIEFVAAQGTGNNGLDEVVRRVDYGPGFSDAPSESTRQRFWWCSSAVGSRGDEGFGVAGADHRGFGVAASAAGDALGGSGVLVVTTVACRGFGPLPRRVRGLVLERGLRLADRGQTRFPAPQLPGQLVAAVVLAVAGVVGLFDPLGQPRVVISD
jgi:hypothetical protein